MDIQFNVFITKDNIDEIPKLINEVIVPNEKKFLSEIKANTEAELVKLALSLSDEERKKHKPGFMNGIWLVAD